MKKFSLLLLASFAFAALAPSVAWGATENPIIYTLNLWHYYKDGGLYTVKEGSLKPDFISGTCGSFVKYQGFSSTSEYKCNSYMPKGYYVSGWELDKEWEKGATSGTKIKDQEWGAQDSVTVSFQDGWYDDYQTKNLELVVSINQKTYSYSYALGGGTGTLPDGKTGVKYWTTNTAASATSLSREGYTFQNWKCSNQTIAAEGKFTGSTLGITSNGDSVTLTAQWTAKKYTVTKEEENCTVTVASSGTFDKELDISWAPKGDAEYIYTLESVKVKYADKDLATYQSGTSAKFTMTGTYYSSVTVVGKYTKTKKQYKISTSVTPTGSGSVNLNPTGGTYDSGTEITLEASPYSGNQFISWQDGVTENPRTITVTSNATYKATFAKIESYQIVIYPGWTGGEEQLREYQKSDKIQKVTFNTLERGGYTREKWVEDFSEVSGTNPTMYESSVSIPAGTTGGFSVTAQWKGNTYTITVNASSGSGGGSINYTVTNAEQNVSFASVMPTREGYTNSGWVVSSGYTGNPPSVDGDRVKIPADTYNDFSISPTWKGNSYTAKVVALADGPAVAEINYDTKESSQTFEVDPWPTRTGYDTISGWTFNDYGGSKPSMDTAQKKLTIYGNGYGDFTAIPSWSPNSYEIDYKNCNTSTMPKTPKNGTYDQVVVVSNPTDESRPFAGWRVSDGLDASTAWYSADGVSWYPITSDTQIVGSADYQTTSFSNLTAKNSATVSLWAEWGAFRTISTQANPENAGSVTGGGVYRDGEEVELCATASNGWSFVSWQDGETEASRTITVASNATYTACFTGIEYVVTFYVSPGKYGPDAFDVRFGEPYGENLDKQPGQLPAGKCFSGWFTDKTGGVNVSRDSIVSIANNHTLYAHYEDYKFYWVSFDGNGATNKVMMDVQEIAKNTPTALSKNEYGKVGAWFANWTNSTGTVYKDQEEVTDIADPGKTNTLYATWTPWKNYVRFDGNGVSGTMAVQEFTYGVSQALTLNTFKNKGYTFAGWTNEVAGTFYTDGEAVTLTQPDNTTNTLKAVWSANTYTIRFEPNAAGVINPGAQADIACASGVGVTLPACAYTNLASQGFVGWVYGGVTNAANSVITNYVETSGAILTMTAAWKGVGDLSWAVGLTNAVLTSATSEPKWSRIYDSQVARTGDLCVGATQGATKNEAIMSMVVNGPGTLTFWYNKVSPQPSEKYVDSPKLKVDSLDAIILTNVTKYAQYTLTVNGEGLHTISWNRSDGSNWGAYYIDDVTWTPGEVKPVPGKEDVREISDIRFEGGNIKMSFTNANSSFTYLLRGTNDLHVARPWSTLWETNGTGTITIEAPIDPSQNQMFYYLETTQKQ